MSTRSSTLVRPQALCSESDLAVASGNPRLMQLMQSLYQADQQAKYLNLQAEVETLLQELQNLKQERLDSDQQDSVNCDDNWLSVWRLFVAKAEVEDSAG